MSPTQAEEEAGEQTSIKQEGSGNNDENETQRLEHRESPTSKAPSVKEAPAESPLRFYARLRQELESRGINYDELPRRTPEGEAPLCFIHKRAPFAAWLGAASLLDATVPYRFDMPAEPNYCWDCTPEFKRQAMAAGVCQFPHVRFETVRTVVRCGREREAEVEVVGVSRPPLVQGIEEE